MAAAFTERQPDLAKALVAAVSEMTYATKGSVNPHFKSKFAGLPDVIAAVKPALSKHGLCFLQDVEAAPGGIAVSTIILHTSGQFMRLGTVSVPALKADPQAYGSAITYAKRYSLQAALGIPSDDDDGEYARKANEAQEEMKSSKHKDAADAAIEKYESGDVAGAVEELYSFEDREDTLAAFGHLGGQSKMRADIKKFREEMRKRDAEIAKMPAAVKADADGVIA